jgi:penicillin-binding protein 1C
MPAGDGARSEINPLPSVPAAEVRPLPCQWSGAASRAGRPARTRLRRAVRCLAGALVLAGLAFGLAWILVPFPDDRLAVFPDSIVLLDAQNRPLRVQLGVGDVDCRPIPLARAGLWTAQAIQAVEDKRFYRHPGVDFLALARAAYQNLGRGRVVSGASTLSTQVVKLSLPPCRRTLRVKLVEAVLAFKLERRFTKDQILALYLNRAPFGSNLIGLESASLRYFGKHAADLSLAEAALLAGLPKSPSRLRPDRHPDRARARRDFVLERMEACGFITPAQRAAAAAEPVVTRTAEMPFRAPHFCDLVLAGLARPGSFMTTLDGDLQSAVERLVQRRQADLAGQGVHGAAVVVLDVASGSVRALVGSPDYHDRGHAGQVNAACAPRSPGSALKPFIYALALEAGLGTPAFVVGDVPLNYRQYKPLNFSLDFLGPVSLREALVRSLNIPALRLTEQLGPARVLEEFKNLGFSTLTRPASDYGLAVALGGGEVTLLELANAYACLARRGLWQPVRLLEDDPMPRPRRALSEESAFLVADMLSGDERLMELCGHAAAGARRPVMAWKTGTSSGFRDAWTVAYNPEFVVAVWLGNPDGTPSEALVGGLAAAPLAADIFRRCYPAGGAPEFVPPAGLAVRKVCSRSGRLPGPYCPHQVEDYAIPGVSPNEVCRVHQRPPVQGGEAPETWPAPIARFLRERGMESAPAPARVEDRLAIASPVSGETFRLLADSPGLRQELPLSAVSPDPDAVLYWFVNDRFLQAAPAADTLFWPLARGQWTITCADSRGRRDAVRIRVE